MTAERIKTLREQAGMSQEKLAKLQRRLNRMQPGSNNYNEAVQKYRELHEHIANQRRDFIHKESSRIANGWDAVCMRDDACRRWPGRSNWAACRMPDSGCSGSACATSWRGREKH